MRVEPHLMVAKARVRGVELSRHAAARFSSSRAFALATAVALPRMWQYVTDSALEGFGRGLEKGAGAGGRTQLQEAFMSARRRVAARVDALLERMRPDTTLTALLVDAQGLHIMQSGSGRVYVHRAGTHRRYTPREDSEGGLLRHAPVNSMAPLEPGDLVLAGSTSAFSVKAVGQLASLLASDAEAPPSVIASILLEPAAQAGVGGAVLAMRIQ